MRLRPPARQRPVEENIVPLINIVFLILIFLLVTSTVRSFDPADVSLAKATATNEAQRARNVLVIKADGELVYRGRAISRDAAGSVLKQAASVEPEATLMLAPDAALAAQTLVSLAEIARTAGFRKIILINRKSTEQ